MSEPMLQVENLRISFPRDGGRFVAVENLSYTVEPGKALAVVGESGSGKTVGVRGLLRLLPKEARIESGTATFGGRDLIALRDKDLRSVRGKEIGMVFQNAMEAMNPTISVGKQLMEALLWHKLCSRSEARERAVRALGDVGIPEPEKRIKMYPFQFSGGMRQRAMIAMALINNPKMIIADEPTTALDVTVQAQILDLLADIKSRGTSMIMITHDLGVARKLCDTAVVMRRGEMVESGDMAQILDAPQHEYTQMLLNSTLEVDRNRVAVTEPEPEPDEAEALVQVRGLHKTFITKAGANKAVDDVNFAIPAGSTLGLVGESGSGKSTVARLVLGLYEPDEGEVLIDGRDPQKVTGAEWTALRRSAQMVFQNAYGSLLPHYTVGANIAEVLRLHGIGTPAEQRDKAAEMLTLVGLSPDDASRYPQQFSGGQQQRIAIARALAPEPRMLVCDEPTSSLDVSIQAQILDLLEELRERLNLTCLLITHNLGVVEKMADHIAVMKSGRIVETGTTDQVFTAPEDPYTVRLLDAVLPVKLAA